MASSLKTVEFAFPALASLTDNSLTTLTQITVYLPDVRSPSSTAFKSVIAQVTAMGTATATGNITTRQLQCRLGAAAYTAHTNSNLHTGSAEDIFTTHAVNLTTHFNTNWSGTSMTMDAQVLLDGTATGIAWTNVCVTVFITYEFDDTASTQIKTVRIPLDMPTSALATSKPGTALATIPALDTELPEASKSYRNRFVTVQGNVNRAGTTDITMSLQLDSTASRTTGVFEGVSNTDYWYRYVWEVDGVLDTASSMGFYAWGNAADFDHAQAWLTVTYEFDATAANDVFVSLLLPMEVSSPMGGTTSADYQRGTREFWIQEPATITTKQIAFYSFWDQAAAIAGLNMRVGTGSFVSYTDVAATTAGSNGAMTRNDSAFTLARGRNTLSWDVYRTDTADFGFNVSGFWIVNYTAGKPTNGHGAANRTVFWNLGAVFDGAASILRSLTAVAVTTPDAKWFRSAVGTRYHYISNTTGTPAGVSVLVERLAAEGGVQWEPAYADICQTDPETGIRICWSQVRSLFNRWTNDPMNAEDSHGGERMSLDTARRWRTVLANGCASFDMLDLIFTYHTISYTIGGNIIGSNGGTVNITAHRASSGEIIAETSRVGDGAFSMDWYDNTEDVYCTAVEGTTHRGRSADLLAAGSP